MNKIFAEKLGKTIEACINDMLVKSKSTDLYIHYLRDTFEILRKYSMKA